MSPKELSKKAEKQSIARFAQDYFLRGDEPMQVFGTLRFHHVLLPPELTGHRHITPALIVRKQDEEKIAVLESHELIDLFQRIVQYGGYIDGKLWKPHGKDAKTLPSAIHQLNKALSPLSPKHDFMEDRVFPCGYAYKRNHRLRHTLLTERIKSFYNYRTILGHDEDIITFNNPMTMPNGDQVDLMVGRLSQLQDHLPHPKVEINPDVPNYLLMTTAKQTEQFGQWNKQTVFMEITSDEQGLIRTFSSKGQIELSSQGDQRKEQVKLFNSLMERMGHFGYRWQDGTGIITDTKIILPHFPSNSF